MFIYTAAPSGTNWQYQHMSSVLDSLATAAPFVAGAAAAAGAFFTTFRGAIRSYKRDVAENRQRLQRELHISGDGHIAIREPQAGQGADSASGDSAEPGQSATTHNTVYNITVDQAATAEELRADREEQTFSLLLADYYAHGLTQAQRSSITSLAFSGLGCVILKGRLEQPSITLGARRNSCGRTCGQSAAFATPSGWSAR
ncbi:hypothetical protein [Streptomyces sp. NBC_01353]|uniref:hypothetical protein n=1 Tax=Streptomyces sp. NBC_01353 TaxID=2903835 RepID=UPI002E32EC4F|nr:hypothetical protein [Streptomyces sp. NBC_01353]